MKKILLLVVLAFALNNNLGRANSEPNIRPFYDRFEVQYDELGKVKLIALNRGAKLFSIGALLEEIVLDIAFLKTHSLQTKEYFFPTEREGSLSSFKKKNLKLGRRTVEKLANIDFHTVLENSKFKKFLKKLEEKISKHLIGHRVLAAPTDPYYFQTRGFLKEVWSWGKTYIKAKFAEVPVVNIALFVVDRAIAMVQERRVFYQFMLMHYLDEFEPWQLGMTSKDARRAFSSIYSMKIDWYKIFDSRKAKKNWLDFGYHKFSGLYLGCSQFLNENYGLYDESPKRLNFAFMDAIEKGQRKIVNLLNPRFKYSSRPSTSYYYGQPRKVETLRRFLRLLLVGSRFVTIPALARTGFEKFVKSMYVPQLRTEGALFGYLESNSMKFEFNDMKRQMTNPYISESL